MGYELIWEPFGVIKRFHGPLTAEEHLEAHHRVMTDPRMDAHIRYVINDFTDSDRHELTDRGLEQYQAERIGSAAYLPKLRGAFVATAPAMVELAEALTSPRWATLHECRVFSTVAEARRWLGA